LSFPEDKIPEEIKKILKGKSKGMIDEYGQKRVLLCCRYAVARNADNQVGFVIRALIGGWDVPGDVEQVDSDPLRYVKGKYADYIDH